MRISGQGLLCFLCIVAAVGIVILSLVPWLPTIVDHNTDQVLGHIIAYGILAFLLGCLLNKHPWWLLAAIITETIIFGGGIEVVQSQVPVRDISLVDLGLNAFGGVVGVMFAVGAVEGVEWINRSLRSC
jgi:VanZ family protein